MTDRRPAVAPRRYNLALAATTVIAASSSDQPIEYLRYPTPTQRWRTRTGWTIKAGFNDKINFNLGGVLVATIAPGYYPTAALLCAAIVAALTAAVANAWVCSYDSGTHKFTISGTAAFILLFGSGANVETSAAKSLGWTVADTSSATSQTAPNEAYQSTSYLLFDFGAASPFTLGIVHAHNMGSLGTVRLYGVASGNPWQSPGTTQVLTGDDLPSKRLLIFAQQTYRYAALVFDDAQNPAGYTEVGVPYIGPHWQSPRGVEWRSSSRQAEMLSTVTRSEEGAILVLKKNSPKTWKVRFRREARADRDIYQRIEDDKGHVFLFRDPVNFPASETIYGVVKDTAEIVDESTEPPLFAFDLVVAEDLG